MKIGKEIALEAKKKGLCKDWFMKMCAQNYIEPLCKMYFDGSDWAMENDFPSLEILRRFKGNSEQFGLFTDYSGTIENSRRTAFFGKSKVEIIAKNYDVQEIYVRHNSHAKIYASDNAFVVVNVVDDAMLEVVCDGKAKVNVYCYGKVQNITTGGTGHVKVELKQCK